MLLKITANLNRKLLLSLLARNQTYVYICFTEFVISQNMLHGKAREAHNFLVNFTVIKQSKFIDIITNIVFKIDSVLYFAI